MVCLPVNKYIFEKMCINYLRSNTLCSVFLISIGASAGVDQYEKRTDTCLTVALKMLAGFQQIAECYFKGSVQDLKYYETSDETVF